MLRCEPEPSAVQVTPLFKPSGIGHGIYKSNMVRRAARWMNALAHPPVAIEITAERLAAVRWTSEGDVADLAVEPLPPGAILPSPVHANLVDAAAVRAALAKACAQLRAQDEEVAVMLPDTIIRVFVQHYEEFPRNPQLALPILRWKLKKSVPFTMEETLISYMRQAPRETGVDIVAGLAREGIVREYHDILKAVNLHAGVVLSSTLAAMALVGGEKPVLLMRISGSCLTSAILRDGVLCAYRCTELPASGSELTPKILLDEVFPVAAYYQDSWNESVQNVLVAGLGSRLPEFVGLLEAEFQCAVAALLGSAEARHVLPASASTLVREELEGLAGWMLSYSKDFAGIL
jgi:type IV pilus assembly protein PilM